MKEGYFRLEGVWASSGQPWKLLVRLEAPDDMLTKPAYISSAAPDGKEIKREADEYLVQIKVGEQGRIGFK
jgi:hypothetical protein